MARGVDGRRRTHAWCENETIDRGSRCGCASLRRRDRRRALDAPAPRTHSAENDACSPTICASPRARSRAPDVHRRSSSRRSRCASARTRRSSRIVDSVLRRGLPYADLDRLVAIWSNDTQEQTRAGISVSVGDYRDYARANRSRSPRSPASFPTWNATYTATDVAERIDVGVVSANFFNVLGSPPAMGRGFATARTKRRAEDGRADARLLDARLQRRSASDRQVDHARRRVVTIIGVMPATSRSRRRKSICSRRCRCSAISSTGAKCICSSIDRPTHAGRHARRRAQRDLAAIAAAARAGASSKRTPASSVDRAAAAERSARRRARADSRVVRRRVRRAAHRLRERRRISCSRAPSDAGRRSPCARRWAPSRARSRADSHRERA